MEADAPTVKALYVREIPSLGRCAFRPAMCCRRYRVNKAVLEAGIKGRRDGRACRRMHTAGWSSRSGDNKEDKEENLFQLGRSYVVR
jgi:hypothetical protein